MMHEEIKHALSNQPYSCKCDSCGNDLESKTDVDNELDMIVHVKPCDFCISEAKKEGQDDAD